MIASAAVTTRRSRRPRWLSVNVAGFALLGLAFIVSLVHVLGTERELNDPDAITVRIAHWQLEAGYREAMQEMIRDYETLQAERGKRVKVIQMPVTERLYPQWLNVHLTAGDAPDITEMGYSKLVSDDAYVSRFYTPLTDLVERSNPYNVGTPLEGVPWRDTFIEGMRNGYRPDLQDYFSAPITTVTIRLFYNKDLFRRASGSDAAPRSMGELLAACDRIRAYGKSTGEAIVPIAGSQYSTGLFVLRYTVPFTSGYEDELDADLDGSINPIETYAGLMTNRISMRSTGVADLWAALRAVCDQFNPGFVSMYRDQAAYLFVNGKAAMLASGSWDAKSFYDQAKEAGFEVGVCDFPLPAPGERWSSHISGQQAETGLGAGGVYGVYKYSRHPEQAIDFLQFLTAQKQNEKLNRLTGWLPITVGAEPSEEMKPFVADPNGYTSAVEFAFGADASATFYGLRDQYLQGEIDYDAFADGAEQALRDPRYGGDRAWGKAYKDAAQWARQQEEVLAVYATQALLDPVNGAAAAQKYRQVLVQQVRRNNGEEVRKRFELVRKKPIEIP